MISTGIDVNHCTLTGNVVRDLNAEKKDIVFFSLATSRLKYRDENGKPMYTSDTHSVVCKGILAEKVNAMNIVKGSRIAVTGVVTYRWRDENSKYPSAEILAETVKVL